MLCKLKLCRWLIHRHIGGLENWLIVDSETSKIHRHIGGLENTFKPKPKRISIHRHIGGLER